MLKALFATVTLSMLVVMGCGKTTEPAKTPGKTPPAEESTFKLELPTTATNIAKGQDEAVKIGVERGEDMKGEVELTFEAPEGLTIAPATAKIAADADDAEVTVKAADNAGVGEKDITVKGKAGGKETSGTFKVEVTDAETE